MGGRREWGSNCNAHSENIYDVIELSVKVHLNVPIPIIIAVTKLDDFWKETQLSRIEIKQSTKHTFTLILTFNHYTIQSKLASE